MIRRHAMPFGAEVLGEEGTRFRLWAPDASAVELQFGGQQPPLPMRATGAGWFERTVAAAAHGTRYAFCIDGRDPVPDPASRFQPQGVHGPSAVVDPAAFDWQDADWRGRPWHEAVIYELHPGTFSAEGGFAGVGERLDYLAGLGVTAIELMPVAAFSGERGWGYDGVGLYAPAAAYGGPQALKQLVQAAHERSLMVFLDVVYNHFGPDGNYLHQYAARFFTDRHPTPWGPGINFDGAGAGPVRAFYLHNALYWLEEFHLDGLRLDAVHAIADDSDPHILTEIAAHVRQGPGRERQIHLVLENDANEAHYLCAQQAGNSDCYDAQWNDDIHHALHVLLTGETDGYYRDYAADPVAALGRCLAEGFAYQGEPSRHRDGERRGEPSASLPLLRFVSFLQNHDQVGNRACGERIHALADVPAVRAATALLLLAPSPPLVFMGQEFAAATPFQYFCDFEGELGRAVAKGRREEFSGFERFAETDTHSEIPDPNDETTFSRSRLDWPQAATGPHAEELRFFRRLLALRHAEIVPRLGGSPGEAGAWRRLGETALAVRWRLGDGSLLYVRANLGAAEAPLADEEIPAAAPLFACPAGAANSLARGHLLPWQVVFHLQGAGS